jgi:hypothetical protein
VGAVLRTLRTIVFLIFTLVFFAAGQALGGFFEGALWFMAFCSAAFAFSTS